MRIISMSQPEYNPRLIRGIRWAILITLLLGVVIIILDHLNISP